MQPIFSIAALVLLCTASSVCFASGKGEKTLVAAVNTPAVVVPGYASWSSFSSSAALPEVPPTAGPVAATNAGYLGQAYAAGTSSRPFSALGVAVKVGAEGVGFDVATPLARKFNIRAGASFFSYMHSLKEDGITINPDLQFRTGRASLDWFAFGGGFHLSPGFVFYNGNHATATANVPGGQQFTLNDVIYTSSTTDPVHGSAEIVLNQHKIAPSFTVGWGNMVPRHGHWSVPFEVGFEYIGPPTFTYNLAGTACNQYGCMNVATSPDIQSNIRAEQNELNSDIYNLRFYPILTIGLGYKFGH